MGGLPNQAGGWGVPESGRRQAAVLCKRGISRVVEGQDTVEGEAVGGDGVHRWGRRGGQWWGGGHHQAPGSSSSNLREPLGVRACFSADLASSNLNGAKAYTGAWSSCGRPHGHNGLDDDVWCSVFEVEVQQSNVVHHHRPLHAVLRLCRSTGIHFTNWAGPGWISWGHLRWWSLTTSHDGLPRPS